MKKLFGLIATLFSLATLCLAFYMYYMMMDFKPNNENNFINGILWAVCICFSLAMALGGWASIFLRIYKKCFEI